MIKSKLSERDICTKYITPALTNAGWNNHPHHFREEVSFTAGRIKVRGKLVSRGKGKRADYILYSKPNQPIAVIEAKDNTHSIGTGMQQGLEYAEILDLSFAYSSNGDGFVEHDKTTGKERELALHEFPAPDELWNRLNTSKGIDPD
jgi:type I restriction enzyme R subunit